MVGVHPFPGEAVIATEFFTVNTVLLRRFCVTFWIEVGTRVGHLGGITTNPTGPWTTEQARNPLVEIRRSEAGNDEGPGQ